MTKTEYFDIFAKSPPTAARLVQLSIGFTNTFNSLTFFAKTETKKFP